MERGLLNERRANATGRRGDGKQVRLAHDAEGGRGADSSRYLTSDGSFRRIALPKGCSSYARNAEQRGLKIIIAGAGGAAHLPGMVASLTTLPVLGVPVQITRTCRASIRCCRSCRCRAACPVGTLAIGEAGAKNAALLAVRMLANEQPELRREAEGVHRRTGKPSVGGCGAYERSFCPARRSVCWVAASWDECLPSPPGDWGTASTSFARRRHADRPGRRYGNPGVLRRPGAVAEFARSVDVVTFEFENVPAETSRRRRTFRAGASRGRVLHTTQHRLREKTFLRERRDSCDRRFGPSVQSDDLQAVSRTNCPAVLKTAAWGYDGKGQVKIESPSECRDCVDVA